MNFKRYLTNDERLACMKAGMVRKMASLGVRPSSVGLDKMAMVKSALGPVDFFKAFGSGIGSIPANAIALAFVTGIPLGAMLHYIDRSMTKDSKKTQRLEETRDTYNMAMESMKSRLRNGEYLQDDQA